MPWADTHRAIRDTVLLLVGAIGLLNEGFREGFSDRPILVGAFLGCLGISLYPSKKADEVLK